MRGKRILVAVAVAGAAFGIATAVQAAIPDASGIVTACYQFSPPTTQKGVMRAINAEGGEICRFNENQIELATPAYVQSVVQNFQNLTMVEGPTTSVGVGLFGFSQTCPAGYIAISGSLVIQPGGALVDVKTLDGWNAGLFNNAGPPNGTWTMEGKNDTAGAVPVAIMVTCALHQSLGLATPKATPAVGRP